MKCIQQSGGAVTQDGIAAGWVCQENILSLRLLLALRMDTLIHTAAYYNYLGTVLLLLDVWSICTFADYEKATDLTEHELILAVLEEEDTLDYA